VIEIPENGCYIGRNSGIAPEVLDHNWVSENHCFISNINNEYYAEDFGSDGNGSTNGTYLNGDKLPKRIPTKLYDGNMLKLAHLLFQVKIDYPKKQEPDKTSGESTEQLIWVIECPVTGKRFIVENANSRKDECDCCDDYFDRKEISKVKPKQVKAV
jgi:hypothetical protein